MYDCNLIKSRAQKIQESQLPEAPAPPTARSLQPEQPEAVFTCPLNPLRPKTLLPSRTFSVPSNPLLPPEYADILDYESLQYMNGFLRTQIGSYLEVDFLIGSTNLVKHYGILKGIGLNYILLKDPIAETDLACDFHTIKFIKVLTPFNEAADALEQFHNGRRKQLNSNQPEKVRLDLKI
ncbi:MAG: hypothetical protein PHE79_01245 [Eubacteriales bacterium]|nr:hypothetical protein [Eubacteriales bacterium]